MRCTIRDAETMTCSAFDQDGSAFPKGLGKGLQKE